MTDNHLTLAHYFNPKYIGAGSTHYCSGTACAGLLLKKHTITVEQSLETAGIITIKGQLKYRSSTGEDYGTRTVNFPADRFMIKVEV